MSCAKRLLLLDAVEWDPIYPTDHYLRNVPSWFLRHFQGRPDVEWTVRHFTELPLHESLSSYAGVVMTGAPRDAWADDPVNDRMCELVRSCLDASLPYLGVCYGHQILGRTLGASVGRHPEGLQLGPVRMELTAAGRGDLLFDEMDPSFEALSGHADYVAELPEGCEHLASGGVTAMQGIRYGTTCYGVQFHPEMDAGVLKFLWTPRVEAWQARVRFDLEERIATIHDTPQATRVLTNFVDKIV